jgi:hypothetical protein
MKSVGNRRKSEQSGRTRGIMADFGAPCNSSQASRLLEFPRLFAHRRYNPDPKVMWL